MRFEIHPVPGESFKGCQALVKESLPPDRSALIAIGVYIAAGAAAFLLTPATAGLTLLISIGAILALVFGSQAYAKARLARLLAADKHALETHFVEVDDTGARTWCNHIDARFVWSDFALSTENAEFFLLVRPGGSGIAIPKRVVGDGAVELRERLSAWMAQTAASRSSKAL
jgi:hypothetical protein